jgi:hypothetical protein
MRRWQAALGLTFSPGSVAGVRVERRGSARRVTAGDQEPLPVEGDARDLAQAVARLAGRLDGRGLAAWAALDDVQAAVRLARLPNMTLRELRQALQLDAQRFVPFEPHQAYLDFAIVGRTEDGAGWRVLLAAAPRARVDTVVESLRLARIPLRELEAESLCLARALSARGLPTEATGLLTLESEASPLGAPALWTGKLTLLGDGLPLVTRRLEGFPSLEALGGAVVPAVQFFYAQNRPLGLRRLWVVGPYAAALAEILRAGLDGRLPQEVAIEVGDLTVDGISFNQAQLAAWGAVLGEEAPGGLWR